jgi:hypothetical protein
LNASADTPRFRDERWTICTIAVVCVALTAIGARPFAGSWNDGSRLATVEALADHGTFAIDDSIFCRPPADKLVYGTQQANVHLVGTYDKLFIEGRYYSDKPALVSMLLAGLYRLLQFLGFPTVAERPDVFCWTMTVCSSGLAFAVGGVSMYRLGGLAGLPNRVRWLWLASFLFATVAFTYTRSVNNHMMLLGVVAAICLKLIQLAFHPSKPRRATLLWLGTLAGLGFNLDFGGGPLLVLAVVGCVLIRCGRIGPAVVVSIATVPWVAAGLGINYAIGGVWKPINMIPEYLDWPNSPFNQTNLTGFSRHGPARLVLYAFSLLFGRQGFHLHNLTLLLTLPAAWIAFRVSNGPRLRAFRPESTSVPIDFRAEMVFMVGWCVATWLLYSFLSNNNSGICCSVRWFVPFLAPSYLLLAVAIRDSARLRRYFYMLSAWGAVNGVLMWTAGPWVIRATPLFWVVVAAATVSCGFMLWKAPRKPAEQNAAIFLQPKAAA